MKGYIVQGYDIDVEFTHVDGKFTIVPATKGGLASASLWADIEPGQFGDYTITAVYIGSHFTSVIETLTGEAERTGIALLQANEKWRDWAAEEVCEEPPYDRLRASDVVDCGRRV